MRPGKNPGERKTWKGGAHVARTMKGRTQEHRCRKAQLAAIEAGVAEYVCIGHASAARSKGCAVIYLT